MCKRDDVLNFPTFNKEKRIFEGPFQFTEGTGFVKYQIPKEALSAHWIGLGNRSFEGIITVNVSKLSREIESDFLARFDGCSVLALVYDLKMECFFDMYDVGDISHDVHPENGKTEHIMKISTGPTCYFNYYLVPEEVDVICERGITNILYKSNFKVIPPTNNFFYVIIVFVYFLLFLLFCIPYQPLLVKA